MFSEAPTISYHAQIAVHQRWNRAGFWPLTRPDPFWLGDPTRSLSVVKQILDNGLTAVGQLRVWKVKPFSGLVYSISRLSESVLLEKTAW